MGGSGRVGAGASKVKPGAVKVIRGTMKRETAEGGGKAIFIYKSKHTTDDDY